MATARKVVLRLIPAKMGFMNVFVDADACPARMEITEVCARHGIVPVFVANKEITAVINDKRAKMEVVTGSFDAADDWIAGQAKPGDLVMTADLLLAQRVVKNHSEAMNFSGGFLTDDIIHDLVAQREINNQLRQMNMPAHQPSHYGKLHRSALKSGLHQWIESRKRRSANNANA
jgi:uncharacterized protein YaiI (UPF0178 family)